MVGHRFLEVAKDRAQARDSRCRRSTVLPSLSLVAARSARLSRRPDSTDVPPGGAIGQADARGAAIGPLLGGVCQRLTRSANFRPTSARSRRFRPPGWSLAPRGATLALGFPVFGRVSRRVAVDRSKPGQIGAPTAILLPWLVESAVGSHGSRVQRLIVPNAGNPGEGPAHQVSGLRHRTSGKRAKSVSAEHNSRPCSIARAAR